MATNGFCESGHPSSPLSRFASRPKSVTHDIARNFLWWSWSLEIPPFFLFWMEYPPLCFPCNYLFTRITLLFSLLLGGDFISFRLGDVSMVEAKFTS